MATTYNVLTDDEKDDILISFLQAQERDAYCHEVNIERYKTMIPLLEDGDFKTRCQKLLQESEDRLTEVTVIINATVAQLPTSERITASVVRLNKTTTDTTTTNTATVD